ncbi:MAG: MFS transporter [Betaproteobacteria bacterium]|nr:MFS transporter [Betaproteobacteria bacterium]
MNGLLAPGVRPREVWAWAMYDFANSGYTTVVITAVFNAYFVATVAAKASWATLAWTVSLSVSYAVIMLVGPALGAYCDRHSAKRRVLMVTTLGCIVGTVALGEVGPGQVALAVVLIVVSNTFYGLGENVVAGFLPELAQGKGFGRISAWGWSLGYIGGLVALGVVLAYITWAQSVGQGADRFVAVSLWITAGLFLLASLPAFVFLRERPTAPPPVPPTTEPWSRQLGRLRQDFPDLTRFLFCIVLYQSGVQAVIALAAIYAQEAMHFETQDTLKLILVVNVTASLGAFVFGFLQDRLGHLRTIALTLLGWCVMVVLAWAATTPALFWVAANVAGVCLGSSQAAGRALVGFLSPPSRRAEFFGYWGVAVKVASILGPLTYGLVTWVTNNQHRQAMLITGAFFVLGLGVLNGVDVRGGRRRALRAEWQTRKAALADARP